MTKALKEAKLEAHLDAIEKHKALLEQLHLNGNQHLDEVNNSLQALALTLEEYLKIVGIPEHMPRCGIWRQGWRLRPIFYYF